MDASGDDGRALLRVLVQSVVLVDRLRLAAEGKRNLAGESRSRHHPRLVVPSSSLETTRHSHDRL